MFNDILQVLNNSKYLEIGDASFRIMTWYD